MSSIEQAANRGIAGIERAHALDARYYIGADWLACEREQVFAASWQLAAHREELAGTGDHVATEIAGRPVVLLRHPDGQLRGFLNVCRHRAGPLVWCNGRGARSLVCRYHGWNYTLDGQLKTAPEMDGACDFDPATIRLTPVRTHEWQGLVFVALTDAAPPFEQVYGGIAERIQPVDLSRLRFTRRVSYDVECNWKVYVDNFLEGYHLPLVHPALSRVVDYKAYTTELFDWYSLQQSPLRDAEGIYGDGEAWYYFVFPNVMLNIMPGRLQANRVLPLGHQHCRVEFDYFYACDAAALARVDNDLRFSDEIQMEDVRICEAVQKGLTSGSYQAGRLCPRREGGVWHFQNLLRRAYAARA